jgi:isocitrate lyase
MVQAGLKAIYGSGWQVAADGNTAGDVYPDQSLYPCDSAPNLVKRINRALLRADQIESAEGKKSGTYWFAPIVADAEAGFGGSLNAYELMKAMVEAGAAGVHFEDQLSSAKKCGHLGGKVVVPTREFIEKLVAARLAADVCGVPTILIARTDANSAGLLLADADPRDREFIYAGLTRRLHAGWLTRLMPICCGAKRPRRIWRRRGNSLMRSTRNSPESCWRTTVRRRLTGRKSWTT